MWFVYIIKCRDGSLYTGATVDLDRRFKEHKDGKGGKYTRSHIPQEIVFSEECGNKSLALKKEWEIKSWPRKKKIDFIKNKN